MVLGEFLGKVRRWNGNFDRADYFIFDSPTFVQMFVELTTI